MSCRKTCFIHKSKRYLSIISRDTHAPCTSYQYHEVISKVQRRVREMENIWLVQRVQEIQALSDSNNSKATKKIYGPSSLGVRPVVGKDGTLFKDLAGIRDNGKNISVSCRIRSRQ